MRVCIATAHTQNQNCTLTAKTRAVHSLITASVGLSPVAKFHSPAFNRSATFTNYIAGPLGVTDALHYRDNESRIREKFRNFET
jgi:hypothetical protein